MSDALVECREWHAMLCRKTREIEIGCENSHRRLSAFECKQITWNPLRFLSLLPVTQHSSRLRHSRAEARLRRNSKKAQFSQRQIATFAFFSSGSPSRYEHEDPTAVQSALKHPTNTSWKLIQRRAHLLLSDPPSPTCYGATILLHQPRVVGLVRHFQSRQHHFPFRSRLNVEPIPGPLPALVLSENIREKLDEL